MRLYDYDFCHGIVHGGWGGGIIGSLNDMRESLWENFREMDFENADAKEEMRDVIEEMTAEINDLISDIQSVHFR
ncbi:hypothetical protein D1970_18195 [Mesobacillus zeae]|uniref:Uncharacterized protein n=2 Tax=Mesobacillus zeae TaxID=1917180 RepID=A0A398AYL4_9BACI|nr:hypothetical protein D1970_18195 [Mesobacillus zeae]